MGITQDKKAHSTKLRQFIIDKCSTQTHTVEQLGIAFNINKKNLNHHLQEMIEEGYIHKISKYHKFNGAWANGYATIRNEPYQWAKRKSNVVQFKKDVVIDYEQSLMFRMGYTNLGPIKGDVHYGLMSKSA